MYYLDYLDAGVLCVELGLFCVAEYRKNDKSKPSQYIITYLVSLSTDKYTFKPNPIIS